MRFSHFLKYNAVPEWQNQYMDYNELKNLIYTLQADQIRENGGASQGPSNNNISESSFENTPLPNDHNSSKNGIKAKLKDRLPSRFFRKHGRNNESNRSGTPDVQLETIELEDYPKELSSLKKHEKNDRDFTPAQKFKQKFFDSRRSSASSSDDRTLFSPYDTFVDSLVNEKVKIDDFYKRTETKFFARLQSLVKDLEKEGLVDFGLQNMSSKVAEVSAELDEQNNSMNKGFNLHYSNDQNELRSRFDASEDIDEEDIDGISTNQENTALLGYSQVNIKSQKRSLLKHSVINLYIDLCQLKSFIELNRIGFSKITKKFDKVLHMTTRADLIQSDEFFQDTYIFQDDTLIALDEKIDSLVHFYGSIATRYKNSDTCKEELKSYLHDHIVWERSKTWKDMLGLLSQDRDIKTDLGSGSIGTEKISNLDLSYYSWKIPTPIHWKFIQINYFKIPKLFFTLKALKIAFIIVFTGILLGVKTLNDRVEGRCLALVECCALLWATEAIPLHVTAFLVPLLTVLFRVLKNSDGSTMSAAAASSAILSDMWSSTIMILLAGFTIAEALSQFDIAKILASWLLAFAGTKPRNVLLMAMCVVFFLSMWISNVASPVLTYSLVAPLLESLHSDDQFAKALVMGVALSADISGMSSPISSPQNIISMEYLSPYGIGWGQFFAVALPCGILAMLLTWGLLCLTFKINGTKLEKFTPIKTTLTLKQYYIVFVTLGTILLWCVESKIQSAFGSSGQIAIFPIVLFFGTGILSTKDLNTFPWSIVILAMGGIALGDAVSSSGLLKTIATSLQKRIENDTLLAILCIFGILMLVVGTFVSHTVSAIIIIPLVQEVGEKLSSPKAAPVLVFGCALLASCGMGLASSGFPNVTAISMTDREGKRYLNVGTFISRGVPASIIAFLCVITMGYGIMISIVKGVTTV
ncbi:hypothetical protein KAFR_0G00210 [Kazachstania africana CBS 2517]|uniref:SPX domain-containing protein n=1 Tax=Kazachstania africana (strain ATCC 22294 / BCRC 22015 / CBS 2517 / CECT 1963 / NBRC 1671 / NRRL Y-8276) TaxID=1071382 RepID=H2AXF4_KAZAF|nr:hypothetical protein KAFR_0G00210 [Kazachstania africana CBS 2517]CCF59054.1 hypothetical protein KAFR_0G00210 [Kazachstania africana CBS 2517]